MRILAKWRWLNMWISLMWMKKLLANRVTTSEKSGLPDIAGCRNVNRVDYILNYCKDRTVLHIGFSDYPYTEKKIKDNNLLHFDLKLTSKDLWGLDNNEAAIQTYQRFAEDHQVIYGDIMDDDLGEKVKQKFEIVLLAEIIEHLKNPHQAIENLYTAFPAGTMLVVTTPNYSSLTSFAAALHSTEMIHPDHYWYFSPVTFLKMFPDDRFHLTDLNFGMYFQKGKKINFVLQKFPFLGDCLIAVFKIKKQ